MVEAAQGFAALEDVDEATVVRFAQWAYTGNYSAADFKLISTSESFQGSREAGSAVADPEVENAVAGPVMDIVKASDLWASTPVAQDDFVGSSFGGSWGGTESAEKKSKKKSTKALHSAHDLSSPSLRERHSKETLRELFISRQYTLRQEVIVVTPSRRNQSSEEDYTDVFLSHAMLYVFAEKFDIETLKVLAFERLHNTLAIFTLYPSRTGDITELLRFVYGCVGTVPGMEDLRKLMRDYLGYEMDTLMKDDGFKRLIIENGGTLLEDFIALVQKRI